MIEKMGKQIHNRKFKQYSVNLDTRKYLQVQDTWCTVV